MKSQNFQNALTLTIVALAFSACGPSDEKLAAETGAAASPTPSPATFPSPTATTSPTLAPTSTPTQIPAVPAPPDQIDLFRLIPPGFLSAGYCDMKGIREDPDLKSVFEAVPNGCPLSGVPENVDAVMVVVLPSTVTDSPRITIASVQIFRGEFDRQEMKEQLPEAGVSFQDYQGIEITVIQDESGFEIASALIDEVTWILGPEAGLKAVIDTAQGLTTQPLADLGATLPNVFLAFLAGSCEYDACTAHVMVSLAKRQDGALSTIQLYQFENAEMAASVLPAIRVGQIEESISQFGSVRIIGDTITQEGRFVKVVGTLPMEDLSRMFE